MIAAPVEEYRDDIVFHLDHNQASVADWFLRSQSRVISVMGVRGGGKSALIRAVVFMFANMRRKSQTIYASQSNSNSLDQFKSLEDDETVQNFAGVAGSYEKAFVQKPHPTINWVNGSETIFWAMENFNGKLGAHPNLLIIDEAQAISERVWSKILYPMTVRPGRPCRVLCFGSTPETDGHWFWKLHESGKSFPNDQDVKAFSFTYDTCLSFKGARGQRLLAQTKATMSERDFESEYLMKPGGRGDNYFKKAAIDLSVKAYDEKKIDTSRGTIMVVDPSLGTHDPTAWLITDLKGSVIKSHSIPLGTTDTDMVDEIVQVANENKSLMVVESNGLPRDVYIGMLKKMCKYGVKDVPLRSEGLGEEANKTKLCKQLSWYLEKNKIAINPACKMLIKQLQNMRDYKTPTGKLAIRAPDGEHDDEASCLIVAVEALRRGWSPYLGGGMNPINSLL